MPALPSHAAAARRRADIRAALRSGATPASIAERWGVGLETVLRIKRGPRPAMQVALESLLHEHRRFDAVYPPFPGRMA